MSSKEELFKVMDRIDELKNLLQMTQTEEFELRNLEVRKMQLYSDWKDC